jgi:hypothetical protein
MKNCISLVLFFATGLIACNNDDKKQAPESSGVMDATRNFIQAALKGRFDEAKNFMLTDSTNIQYLTIQEGIFANISPEEKEKYANASIIIESKEDVIKDSIAVVIYKNSYKHNPDTLRIIRQNNRWLVDLKYLYEHDFDTLMQKLRNDTLK